MQSFAPGAVVEGPVLLGEGCRIEPDALVLPGSVLGEGTIVRSGACVWNATVGDCCDLGPGAVVRDCVVAEETRVGPASSVMDGAVIGRGCRLTASARVGRGQLVDPDQVISGAPTPAVDPVPDIWRFEVP